MWLQAEADLLRNVMSAGLPTKIVVLGIGSVDETELRAIASEPHEQNIIHVGDVAALSRLQQVLWEKSCGGKHASFASFVTCDTVEHLYIIDSV